MAQEEAALLDISVESKRLEKQMAMGEALPQIAVGASYGYNDFINKGSMNGMVFGMVKIPITDWGGTARKMQRIDAQMRKIESDRETFLLNTSIDATQKLSAIDKAKALLEKDKKIIALRESIRSSGEEQYRNGVITMTDLMSRIDDEYDAKVAESVHRIQLLMAIYDLKNCMGYGGRP